MFFRHCDFFASNNAGRDVTGSQNVAIGAHAGKTISASNTIAIGTTSRATRDDTVAIGNAARAIALRPVATRIMNVANGVAATDAVNVALLGDASVANIANGDGRRLQPGWSFVDPPFGVGPSEWTVWH